METQTTRTVALPADLQHRLKIQAAKENRRIQELATEAVTAYLETKTGGSK